MKVNTEKNCDYYEPSKHVIDYDIMHAQLIASAQNRCQSYINWSFFYDEHSPVMEDSKHILLFSVAWFLYYFMYINENRIDSYFQLFF